MTSSLIPTGLRCAHKADPLGVAPDRVRFSWILQGAGQAQTAYQILLTSGDAEIWDSGRVESDASADIPYGGPPLAGETRYRWKVQAWDETGAASGWSVPAAFETGILDRTGGWHASWITLGRIREDFRPPSEPGPSDPVLNALMPAPYLRREFRVDQPVAAARLYITALGLYEARLNGQRVGDAVLAPGWTDYAQRIPYQAYDVTGLLRQGANVLGAIAADGWAAGFFGFDAKRAGRHYAEAPELLAELVLRLADGTKQRVVTDDQWQGAFAAIRHADLLMGERHDLSRELHGWDAPGFDAADWRPVRLRERDSTPLVADPGPPIRVTQEITPRSIATDDHGRHIVDFGQNLTGWLRISVDGPPGACIRIRHGEILAPDGTLYTDNLRTARAVDEFTTAGGAAVLEPRFTLHGFRYAEITGYSGDIEQADITARVVHSDIPAAGTFSSSAPWLDQLWRNIDWGQRGNFISVPTDCPQRDERLGWLGDAQVFARTACYNRDVAAFFTKWLDDVADAQHGSGAYPDIAPRLNIPWAGAPAWADAGVIVPWTLHKMYGDTAVLDRHFAAMTRWMEYLERDNPGYLRTRELGNSYNDWLAPVDDKTPAELLASAYWAHDAALMAEIAEATGRAGEAAGYRALLAKLRSAFIDAFVAADGQVTSGTQTAYVLALHMNLVPEELREAAAGHLVEAIRREDWHLTTGFVGVGYILPVLSSAGYDAVAYRLLEQASPPSWRYMIDAGATTIWERWDGWTKERGFQSAWMNSFNHYALGSVGEWLYRFVLGIDQEPGTAGFEKLLVRPHPGGSLSWARGTYSSVRGPVASGWRRDGGRFTFSLHLPPNVTASVRVPSDDPAAVRDRAGAGPVSVAGYPGAPGAREAVFAVGPGSHEFTGPAPTGLLSLSSGSYADQARCVMRGVMARSGSLAAWEQRLANQRREDDRLARQKRQAERDAERISQQEHLASRQQEAADKSAEVQARMTELGEVLTSILPARPLTFERLLAAPRTPEFDPGPLAAARPVPEWKDYAPAPVTGLGRLLGGGRQARQAAEEARTRFDAAVAEHQRQEAERRRALAAAKATYDRKVTEERARTAARNAYVTHRQTAFAARDPEAVQWFAGCVLRASRYPDGFPREYQVTYLLPDRCLEVDLQLPARETVPAVRAYRYVKTRDAVDPVPRAETEISQAHERLVACVALRALHEIFAAMPDDLVQAVVLTGWVATTDRATGTPVRPRLIDLRADRATFAALVLDAVDPVACLAHLTT